MSTAVASTLRLSQLAPQTVQSEIRAMSVACSAIGGVNLAQGVCDTDPPIQVVEAAINAVRDGRNIYARADGIAELRTAIAAKLARFNRISAGPDPQVLVTSGATGAMHASLMALLDPGDECIVFEPFYGYHVSTLMSQRITPVIVPLEFNTWSIDFDRVRQAITPRTRAIILNTPANPSGKVFTRVELERLAEIAIANDLFVFTDEIYEYFVYGDMQHLSIATLPGMAERTITISGFSKTFSVTGWRLGYLAADARWTPAITYFHDLTYVCAPTPLQYGALAGLLALGDDFYAQIALDYQAKRDRLCAALTAAGLNPQVPAGAYYVLADARRLPGADAKAKARELLARTGVAAVAGSAFFARKADGTHGGEDLLRFCFAKQDAELDDACKRLKQLDA